MLLERKWRTGMRKALINKDFSILSNNCWGGGIYEDLGLPYTSPTVGLFFHGPCYLKFLKKLRFYLSCELKFIDISKYDLANKKRAIGQLTYPIALIDDVELHFLHYHSKEEAEDKWNRRKKRINFNNLFVEFGEIELVDYDLMLEFDSLEYKNKLLFSVGKHKDLKSSICLRGRQGKVDVGDIYTNKAVWRKEFDVVKWLNEG